MNKVLELASFPIYLVPKCSYQRPVDPLKSYHTETINHVQRSAISRILGTKATGTGRVDVVVVSSRLKPDLSSLIHEVGEKNKVFQKLSTNLQKVQH